MNHNIKHLFIINPKSFRIKSRQNQLVAKIHQFFKKIENSEYDIYVSQFPRDAAGFIPLFAKNIPDTTTLRVYAVGGDGILFDCLNGIMGLKNVELAAIPYGHTNNFMRGFDKDRISFRLLSQQYNAPTIPMDIMRCGNNYALNYCVVGLEAEAVRRADKRKEQLEKGNSFEQWIGRHLYALLFLASGIAVFSNKKLFKQRYDVDIDGEKLPDVFQGFSIFNSPYYGGNLHPISSAMPNDGILDILTIRSPGILRTFFLFPFYLAGKLKTSTRNLVLKRGKKIGIRSKDILLISMDGIVFFETELDVEILPGAIQFVDASKHGYKGVRP